MSRADIHNIQAAHTACAWSAAAVAPPEDFAVTVTITSRVPLAVRVYTLPTVREIPPVPRRPGTFDSTW
jgi:hypothetical protein